MKTPAIRLSFQCDQNWDEMSPTAKGRFCQNCSREVIDFTSKSRSEIRNHIRNSEGRVCGQVLPSHVDPNIIAELRMPSWVRRTIAVTSMGLIASATPVLAQRTHYVKPTITMPENDYPKQVTQEQIDSLNQEIRRRKELHSTIPKEPHKYLFSTERRDVYLVKKFPFIRVERIYVRLMGILDF